MDRDLEGVVTALGAMAETLGYYRKQLMLNGFSAKESYVLCASLQSHLLPTNYVEYEEEE